MKVYILICELCGHTFNPKIFSGEHCAYCNGKLILVFIGLSDNGDTDIPFQEGDIS